MGVFILRPSFIFCCSFICLPLGSIRFAPGFRNCSPHAMTIDSLKCGKIRRQSVAQLGLLFLGGGRQNISVLKANITVPGAKSRAGRPKFQVLKAKIKVPRHHFAFRCQNSKTKGQNFKFRGPTVPGPKLCILHLTCTF